MRTNHDVLNLVRTNLRLLKLVRIGPCLLKLVRAGLAQLLSATLVIAATTDVAAVAAMSIVAAMRARDDSFHSSAGLSVALCLTQRQSFCLRHIFLCLGWLERGSPWLNGRRWSRILSPLKTAKKVSFISEVPESYYLCSLF